MEWQTTLIIISLILTCWVWVPLLIGAFVTVVTIVIIILGAGIAALIGIYELATSAFRK